MARFPLYVHHDVGQWLAQHRSLERRADWLLAELAARGVAGRPKGVAGAAREVQDLPGHRWRRSGLGGFDYYVWWFEANGGTPFPSGSRVVRTIRHHDVMDRLGVGSAPEYDERPFELLEPLTEQQAAVARARARVRLAVGHPGTGKTGALLYAVLEEARQAAGSRLLYVTLSQGLAEDARLFLDGLPELDGRVEVFTYEDLLAEWSARRVAGISDRAEEQAFLGFLGDQPRGELKPWHNARGALWAEVRAQLIGRALPFAFQARQQPACEQPFLPRETYLRLRQSELGVVAATRAWRLAERFIESNPPSSLQRQAWHVLERIQQGRLDGRLTRFDGLIVDEIQDLTLLQLAVLVEAARRIGSLKSTTPALIAAGDESQVVHPSGFDWGVCKDLLRERLTVDPEEFQLVINQRSPSPLVEASNRTAALYDELPKAYRPQARVEAEKTEATNGRVYVSQVAPDDPHLGPWLDLLLETPASALMVCPGVKAAEVAPSLGEERLADLLYEPALIKGLDRQYVVVLDASSVLGRLRDDVRAAKNQGDRPRYLAARRAIDEFRVAVSRSNETLIFLDRAEATPDPLLVELVEQGPAEDVSLAYLRDVLESREFDSLERLQELLKEAADLLEADLPRALRSLERADGALATLRDPEAQRQAHAQRAEARRRTALRLLAVQSDGTTTVPPEAEARFRQVAEQFGAAEASFRELDQEVLGRVYALLAERYRETPPGTTLLESGLSTVLERYVQALAELPEPERRSVLIDLARAWRDELRSVNWVFRDDLRACLAAARCLAELTGDEDDAQAAEELRQRLVQLLFEAESWHEALATLNEQPDPRPEQLACCYEGLKAWEQAAALREAAGDLEQALEDYRQAGQLLKGVSLAEQLGHAELAASLRTVADLSSQLERLGPAYADRLTEAERRRLAEQLQRAAEKLLPRGRPAPERRKR